MPKQLKIDERDPDWKEEWQGMPEFVQEKQEPYAKIIVRFATQEDLEDFSVMIGQRVTNKTKSIWHPKKSHWGNGHALRRWDDENK